MFVTRGARGAVLTAVTVVTLATALCSALAAGPAVAATAASVSASPGRAAATADGRLGVTVILPITLPATTSGLISSAALGTATGASGVLTSELDAAQGEPVVLAIDPRIIASIRVLGDSAPPSALAWLSRLGELPNESFALQYADADPVVVGQAGGTGMLAPTGFGFAIDPDDFSAASPSPSPSPSTAPTTATSPALPTTPSQVTAFGYTVKNVAWPAADTLAGSDLSRLSGAGFRSVIVESSNVAGGAGGHVSFDGGPTTLGGIVADGTLNSDVDAALAAGDPTGLSTALATFGTDLSADATIDPGGDRVVTLPRDASAPLTNLGAVLNVITTSTTVGSVQLASVINSIADPTAVADRPEPTERVREVASMLASSAADDTFSAVAVTPSLVSDPRRLQLLALLSTAWLTQSGWNAAVNTFLADSISLRGDVQIADVSDLLSLGANPSLPVSVRNALDVPVQVWVIARPLRPVLSISADKRRQLVTVPAGATVRVSIPVQSISNGKVGVEVRLTTVGGIQVGNMQKLTLNVQAGWETAGTLIALILAAAVFAYGIVRNVRRRRKAAAETETPDTQTHDTQTPDTQAHDADADD